MSNATHFMPIKDVNDNTNSMANEGQHDGVHGDCLVTTPKEDQTATTK